MTDSVRKCYDLAKKDLEFIEEIKSGSKSNKPPGIFSDDLDKIIFATMYYGWLIGKGRYAGSLKEYLSFK